MSEYYEFAGGDFSAQLDDAPDFDLGYDYYAADLSEEPGVFDNYELSDAEDDPVDLAEPVEAGTYSNLLDGLDFDFDLDNVDLAGLVDGAFDLIGSDPDESGWWDDLASEHSHDGAYDEVSADLGTNPYVTH
jgi:hypothetical protein